MIVAELVETLAQAQEMRLLRNECRGFMTGDTSEISEQQQREFFQARIVPGDVRAWLLREDGRAVAYGLLRPDGNGAWLLSCGVTQDARGRGLGSAVVALATAAGRDTGRPVRLEVWQDNEPARRAYLKAGYTVTGREDRDGRPVELMECR